MNNRWLCGIALAALVLAGCGGGSGGGGGGGGLAKGGTLKIHVTDAPFPFDYVESASVVIREVRVHERLTDAWSTVFSGDFDVDLVPLQNGLTELLVEAAVPPGTYDQVRLIVDAGEVVLTDDAFVQGDSHTFTTEDGTLFFPSGSQTGIKLNIENDIVVTTQLSGDLLLDFDLARNFVFNGPVAHEPGVRRVIFTPHVRATNVSTAGSITLRALSDEFTPLDLLDDMPIEGATVSVFESTADVTVDAPIATSSTGADGVATTSVPPGTYTVVVEAAGHESQTITDVVVVLANLTDLGDVILAATGTISGVVMSDAGTTASTTDDVVIEGATVDVYAAGSTTLLMTTTTDASGLFQVSGLEAGNYDLTITAPGFEDLSVTGVAATLAGTGDTYLMHALTSTVTGTVTGTAGPLENVAVSVVNAVGDVVATATTAADGTYTVMLPTGTYEVTFDTGTATQTLPLTVVGPTAATLDATFL